MSQRQHIALVTGANRGIGLEIVRQLAKGGIKVLLGARDGTKADLAARKLAEEGLPVLGKQLDVTDQASVDRLAGVVEKEFGRLDILINNAGVMLDRDKRADNLELADVQATLETNLLGAWRVTKAFLPLMRRSGYGRIVNVSSQLGQLQEMTGGYPGYRVSKTALNALTRILAAELRNPGILVNSACPGWVRTDMGGQEAPGTVVEGADTPVWLATLPDDGPTGKFFQKRKPLAW